MPVERELQTLIERNMEAMLGVRFLASEFTMGERHGGRMDSLPTCGGVGRGGAARRR
ncbi:hypothetical protein [Streptomyces sp. ERV7]|uniref:hypothetical protein n=1 Tax=Streptomyces sp. ERV7 TaxID=1322334 RepID=UPI000A44809F|nr:hypothetical protein [Streptomyces sp. ERV7]